MFAVFFCECKHNHRPEKRSPITYSCKLIISVTNSLVYISVYKNDISKGVCTKFKMLELDKNFLTTLSGTSTHFKSIVVFVCKSDKNNATNVATPHIYSH